MRKEFPTTKPVIHRLSSQALPATLLGMLLVFSSSANAQFTAGGDKTISPSSPTSTWTAPNPLFPGESTDFQVYVTDAETYQGKNYTLVPNSTKLVIDAARSIWMPKAATPGATYFSCEILNAGNAPNQHEAKVTATWTTAVQGAGGGGGGGAAAEMLPGEATGYANTKIPVFSWSFNPRLQFADGASLINFTVTGSGDGASISLNNYTIHGASGWSISAYPASQNSISGTVKSSTPGKGKLKIKYEGKDMDESADEIAFAKVDLAIASFGSEPNLKEDRKPIGGVESPAHEMEPGGVVLVPIKMADGTVTNRGKRTKLTLSGNGNSLNEGTYTLTSSGASKLKIFEAAEGGDALPQEKHYSASELSGPKTLYVGSLAFGPGDQTQTGTITLTYKLPLQGSGQAYEIKDEVKVTLLPVEIEQENYNSTQGIRFCRWLDSFTANTLNSDCADNDRDRFRIRIPAVLPNLTKIHIKSTGLLTAVTGGQWQFKYSDGDYDVTMTEENGAMVSTWILLVGDGEDDVSYNGTGTENNTNDQTLLADFNSPIEVTFPEYQNAKVVFSAQKPLGDVEIQPYYLSPAGDVPSHMEGFIKNHLEKMKEIYRQIGVRVGYYGIGGKAVPQAWFDAKADDNSSGDYYYLNPHESELARAAVRGLSVPGKQIRIGYVDSIVMVDGVTVASPSKKVRGFTVLGQDGIIVSLAPAPSGARTILGVTAHEVGHTLGLDHATSIWQRWLMKDDGLIWIGNKPLEHSKRFQSGDFDIIRNNQSFYVPVSN